MNEPRTSHLVTLEWLPAVAIWVPRCAECGSVAAGQRRITDAARIAAEHESAAL